MSMVTVTILETLHVIIVFVSWQATSIVLNPASSIFFQRLFTYILVSFSLWSTTYWNRSSIFGRIKHLQIPQNQHKCYYRGQSNVRTQHNDKHNHLEDARYRGAEGLRRIPDRLRLYIALTHCFCLLRRDEISSLPLCVRFLRLGFALFFPPTCNTTTCLITRLGIMEDRWM